MKACQGVLWMMGLFLSLMSCASWSWNALGHRLIMQMTYDRLTHHTKVQCNAYHRAFGKTSAGACLQHGHKTTRNDSLVNAATWLDDVRARTHAYDAMHYIDIPFSYDGSALPQLPSVHAVSAIESSMALLTNSNASLSAKGKALRILIHAVGDIHQPLHAATRVSWSHPNGDRGGNLVALRGVSFATNLHAYWDKGAGLLVGKRRYGSRWVKRRAAELEQRFACERVGVDANPMHWAEESHALAQRVAYAMSSDHRIDKSYQTKAQLVIERQLSQASCRLAYLLNRLFLDSQLIRSKV